MMPPLHYWLTLFCLGAVLLTGCRTASSSKATSSRVYPFADDLSQKDNSDLLPSAADEQRVEALSRFAVGIIHEMNEEPTEAFEEFLKSVMADPGNEALTLDVARWLLQHKE